MFDEEEMKTFANQDKLPHLPVPPLEHSLSQLQLSLKPFCSDSQEYAQISAQIADFQSKLGRELQVRLLDHATKTSDNWLDKVNSRKSK